MISGTDPRSATQYSPGQQAADCPVDGEDRLEPVLKDLRKLGDYLRYYASLQADSLMVSLRNAAIGLVWAVLGAVIGLTTAVMAVVLLLLGISWGISELAGEAWVGPFVTGLVLLVLTGVGVSIITSRITKTSRQRIIEKYEHKQELQRERYGSDIHRDAARERAGVSKART